MFIDSHCHIDAPDYVEGLSGVFQNMQEAKVSHALLVSVSMERCVGVLALAEQYENIFASVGVHPEFEDTREPSVEELIELAAKPKVVAIGETGLDYYRSPREEVEWQRDRFRRHIRAARACGKPLIIHTRNAAEDTLALLSEEGGREVNGVMHCFTESMEVAKAAMDLGFYISLSGIVTFKNAAALREVAKQVPDDRLLIETDAPYLAPVPHRGQRNEPAYVRHVGEFIAGLRGVTPEELGETTSRNFFRLFASA